MSARLFAFVCLSQFALCSSLPGPVAPRKEPLVVFLKDAATQAPAALLAMRLEVTKLLNPLGYGVEFRTALDSPVSGRLVVADLRGKCSTGASALGDSPDRMDLATTAVANGHILPFSQIHCAVVSRLLTPALSNVSTEMRDSLFGRSLGRILAHELVHILTDEQGHDTEGIAKSHFSAKDLLSAHFSFEEHTLERMTSERVSVLIPVGAATD